MKNYLILTFLLLISAFSFSQKQSEKYSKARIYYNSVEEFNNLLNKGIALDHGKHKKGVYFESDFSETEISIAKKLGMKVDVIIDDVQRFYIDRNTISSKSTRNNLCNNTSNSYPTPLNYNHGSMGGFLTYNEAMQEIDSMVLLYPNLITARAPIGTFKTAENRSLYWVRMSDNPNTNENEPEILYDAVHHAREPIGIQQLIYYMWYLLENYATNSEVKAILDNTELYFVPFVNPDGYIFNESTDPNGGGMWRKNRRDHGNGDYGVDNNRNYDFTDGANGSVWGTTGISNNTADMTYCGTGPFSEPENQAMKWFVEQNDFSLALNNHSYSDILLYPYGFALNRYAPDDTTFVAISDFMTSKTTLAPTIGWDLYPASGDSDDWMYGETQNHNKIFSFTPEIGTVSQGFWPQVSDIDPLCESMVSLNLNAAHLVSNYAKATDLQNGTIASKSGFLKYEIQSIGLKNPSNFSVAITPISSNILNVGTSNAHNNMNLLQKKVDSISYTLDPTIAFGDQIKYVLSVTTPSYIINDTITKLFGTEQVVFSENGNNITGWQVSQSWNTTGSTYYSASSCITDSRNGNYQDNINKTITLSSPVSLVNAIDAKLKFWAKWEIEPSFDYVQCAISIDNGNSWIPQCGKYTKSGTQAQDPNQPIYDGFQTTWVQEEISLNDYLGQSVLVRFQIVSDWQTEEDGFYFDDLEILVNLGPNGINEASQNGIYLGQSFPNPTNGSAIINYVLPQGVDEAILSITNSIGQTVMQKSISNNSTSTNISLVDLNSGVYYYFLNGSGINSETKRMVLIK